MSAVSTELWTTMHECHTWANSTESVNTAEPLWLLSRTDGRPLGFSVYIQCEHWEYNTERRVIWLLRLCCLVRWIWLIKHTCAYSSAPWLHKDFTTVHRSSSNNVHSPVHVHVSLSPTANNRLQMSSITLYCRSTFIRHYHEHTLLTSTWEMGTKDQPISCVDVMYVSADCMGGHVIKRWMNERGCSTDQQHACTWKTRNSRRNLHSAWECDQHVCTSTLWRHLRETFQTFNSPPRYHIDFHVRHLAWSK